MYISLCERCVREGSDGYFRRLAHAFFLVCVVALLTLALPAAFALAEDSSVTGVSLGDGFVVYTRGTVDQTGTQDRALAAVVKCRNDALNDTRIKLSYSGTNLTVREYLSKIGMSESEYLNPKWSNALERIAVQRAVENRDANRSHLRLNGDSPWTASYQGHQSWGEVLAWGYADAESAITYGWASEKDDYIKSVNGEPHNETGHYTFLIDPGYTEYGFAYCDDTASGEGARQYDVSGDPTHFNLSGTFDFPVSVSESELDQGVTLGVPSTMVVGDSSSLSATLVFTTSTWWSGDKTTYQVQGTWSSSDPSAASVSSGNTLVAVGAGSSAVTLSSQGKSWSSTVNVYQKIVSGDVAAIPDQAYTGSALSPAVKVTVSGKTLVQGRDYTVLYSDNVNLGTATVTVSGKGNYTGTVTRHFYIYGDLSKASVSPIPDQAYAGSPITPTVNVRLAGKTLEVGTDYKTSASNNNGVGVARITIMGNGTTYRGSITKSFRIVVNPLPMYRVYNHWSGEHLFTMSGDEVDNLVKLGWKDEGTAWTAPSYSSTPVYRLYNPYSGDHFYTQDAGEYQYLGSIGWNQEGVAFYSADKGAGKPIYRLFNRWLTQGTHLFTTDSTEYEHLGSIGWKKEGIAFYSL